MEHQAVAVEESLVEQELLGETPRNVKFRGTRSEVIAKCIHRWGGYLPVVALLFLAMAVFLYASRMAIPVFGSTANGTVTAAEVRQSGADDRDHLVTYAYHVDQKTIKDTDTVPWKIYRTLPVGSSVRVRYVPQLPTWHTLMPASYGEGSGIVALWVRSAIPLFGSFYLLFFMSASRNRERDLIAYGTPALGMIKSKNSWGRYQIVYEFIPNGGTEPVTNTMSVPLNDWRRLYPGDTRTVLYLSGKKACNTLYQLSNFTADDSANQKKRLPAQA